MGDVGSLGIGGALGTIAVLIKQELVLPILGGVFVLEGLSVMIQVGSSNCAASASSKWPRSIIISSCWGGKSRR